MPEDYIPLKQFTLTPKDFLNKLDFLNWYRFFFILKELARLEPKYVLEVGPGEGTIKRVFKPFVEKYAVMDVNAKLTPDFSGDVRTRFKEAEAKFDCIIAADILEHIPFTDMALAAENLFSYLIPNSHALITIPHRASNFLYMTPAQVPHILRIPTGFLSPGSFYRRFIKRKIWIDPDHQWEIGDGHHTIADVEKVFAAAGFKIEKREALLYVDFWVLKK
ncbi:MAG TPA: methyltransferase domain-containing protein [Candidatus Paceibacterota bacterium]